jgi:hypothetical protein
MTLVITIYIVNSHTIRQFSIMSGLNLYRLEGMGREVIVIAGM